jgi:hypothetical protein
VAIKRRAGQAAPVTEFSVRSAQLSLVFLSGLAAVIGFGMLFSDAVRVPGAFLVVIWTFVAFRARRSSMVVVHPDEVEVRSFVRGRRHALAELRQVDIGLRRMGLYGGSREFLVFERTDGRRFAFMEMNCRLPAKADGTSVVRQAAVHINGLLPESPTG